MPVKNPRYPDSVQGPFSVDAQCIVCEQCEEAAEACPTNSIGGLRERMKTLPKLFVAALLAALLPVSGFTGDIRLEQIRLPAGFEISVYAGDVDSARGLAFGDDGTLYVGSRKAGKVFALVPGKDGVKNYVVDSGLKMPVGVAFYKGDLYASSVNSILRYRNISGRAQDPPKAETVYGGFPQNLWHGWKFIRFGPDGRLYVPVGAPCNVCLRSDERYATIMRLDTADPKPEVFAHGVRNTVGFDWDPRTGHLWFTDNGRDLMGDDRPPDELNCAVTGGRHFGFPYVHGASVTDPTYWKERPKTLRTEPPAAELGPHVAALGLRFYTGSMFPADYKKGVFIAEHGSWNRSRKIGYRITFVDVSGTSASGYRVFAEGWKQGEDAWGRPVDVETGPDGALYVSDDKADAVYRITYRKK